MISIDSVDFIQLEVTGNRIYFPASTHLYDKTVQAIFINSDLDGTDISGNNTIFDPADTYITLFDTEANIVYDKLPISHLNARNLGEHIINKKIDFERSFVDIKGEIYANKVIYFTILIGEQRLIKRLSNNIYSLTYPVGNTPSEISFKGFKTLNNRRITQVTFSGKEMVNGYLVLVPCERGRYMNYVSLSLLYNYENTRCLRFLNPCVVDWERSFILIRPISEALQDNTLTINIYYE